MATSATNLDVNSIVSQLMAVERRPINKLNVKEAGYQAKLSAYGSVKGAVSSFQAAVQSLSSASNFQSLKATTSDAAIFSASATSSAAAGTYSLEVTSLAQAQKLVAAGQTSSTAAIGAGASTTVTFDFGAISGGTFDAGTGKYTGAAFASNGSGTKSVTIDSTNNSLQGIRDAINTAQMGVTATIINDGSGTPYRLALSSDSNGTSNSLKISVSGDAAVSSLLAHDPAGTQNLAETVTAQNADFKVNGVAVSKTSNTVSDVIQGVTLTLNKITTSPATLTVARDTAAVSSSINSFVKTYNDLATTLKNSSAYDPVAKQGAILQGDATVRSLQSQLRSMLSTSVTGTSGVLTTLSDVGVSFQKDGTLALNQTKLDSVMTSNFSDIASLFASVGKATDSLVSFSSATSSTRAGSYAVNITQLATQGTAVGSVAANTTISAGVNDALTLTVDGTSASIVLSAGTYTAQTLAAELQSRINSASALSAAGISVAVTQSGGVLSITSSSYGSTSGVAITGGNGASDLLGTPTETGGVNVAGSIGGVTATGSGQTLSAASGDPQGLSIAITGGALGARGALNYSQGYASTLKSWATSILASDGILASRTDGIGRTITDIGKQRNAMETRLINIEKRYRAQFTALDQMLSSMNQTSNYLTQQLAQLSNLR
ncbi:MAG: flagellar filament capping protein FliD [Gallionella sp.]|nr:flagellar filament capping protein FliD [Gallionella sp.]